MTAPATCTCGTVHLNGCPAELSICISPGFLFDGVVQLRNRVTGHPQDWPVGTAARIRFRWGPESQLISTGTVDDSYLRFALSGIETEQIPRHAVVYIDLNFDNGDPSSWRPWRKGKLKPCA